MYAKHAREKDRKKAAIILIIITVILVNIAIVRAANTDENIIAPSSEQYFELRATQVTQIERAK